jgi:hypothetical protein
MKILFIPDPNHGFGDLAWYTSWPRVFSELGNIIDIFLFVYSPEGLIGRGNANPFHANIYVRNTFISALASPKTCFRYKDITNILENNFYDLILTPCVSNNVLLKVSDINAIIKNYKNEVKSPYPDMVAFGKEGLSYNNFPLRAKPEWSFTDKEFNYINNSGLNDSILIFPISSQVTEKNRNININLILEISNKYKNTVVTYGGRKYVPREDLKCLEKNKVKILWEGYNCFEDESGSPLGKQFALTSLCKASIHAWSGSFTFPMGFEKPYLFIIPEGYTNSCECYAKQYKCITPLCIYLPICSTDIVLKTLEKAVQDGCNMKG